jgi:phage I-like protein
MTVQQAALFIDLSDSVLDGTTKLPKEFRIFRAGKNDTEKGSYLFDAKAAESVMAAAKRWGNDYPMDYAHAMLKPAIDPAMSHRRAAKFRPELRSSDQGPELWAVNVRWTKPAAKGIEDDEWGYTSPAFNHEPGGDRRILELVNVALTNLPATRNHEALVAADKLSGAPPEEETHHMKTVALALALAADAPEGEVLHRATALRQEEAELMKLTKEETSRAALSKVTTLMALVPALVTLMKVSGKESEEDALAYAAEELPKIAKLEKERAQEKAEKSINAKIDAKLVAPSEKPELLELGLSNPELLEKMLAKRTVPIVSGKVPQAAKETGGGTSVPYRGRTIQVPTTAALSRLGFKDADDYVSTEKKTIDEEEDGQ